MPPNPALRFTQANIATQNAVATALNPGVSPPNYLLANYWTFYRRLGCNAPSAPILIPLIDDVSQDMSFPSNATLAATGPELWNVLSPNVKQPSQPNSTIASDFPPFDAPPASMTLNTAFPGGTSMGDRVGILPESNFPTNPGFPPPPSAFPPTRPFPEPVAPRDRVGKPGASFPTNPPFPKKEQLPL
jgi:hypothetical protein